MLEKSRKSRCWRKPGPGALRDLLKHWPVNVEPSFLAGDKSSDIEAARAAGIMAYFFHGGDLAGFVKQKIGARTASPDAN
jgi:D-glycero-D-manno-heptose 1,7-bisphosphate phosphatase